MKMKTQWTRRVVTDMVGDGGSVRLDEELVALTGAEITYEDCEVALAGYGIAVEFID